MKTIENNKQEVKNYLENLSVNELVHIHNRYCESVNCMNDWIYSNDKYFFADFFSGKLMDLAKAISFGDYRYQDDFVKFDAYENLNSLDEYYVVNAIDIDAIAKDIIENPNYYYSVTLI